MDKKQMVSFAAIINHITKYRRITRPMLLDLNEMSLFYVLKVIEKYDEIVCQLLDTIEDINIKTNIYSKQEKHTSVI